MIPRECEKCIHCRVCAYNNPKRKQHCGFYEESKPIGGWISDKDGVHCICSFCGYKDKIHSNFCPNCGTDMRRRKMTNKEVVEHLLVIKKLGCLGDKDRQALNLAIKAFEKRPTDKTNADLFKQTFGLYATEVWAMSESQFLEWLNSEDGYKRLLEKIDKE